jgi:hypothetical protein
MVPFGLLQSTLGPAFVNFADSPHVIAVGRAQSGRTNFIRAMMRSVIARYSPDEAIYATAPGADGVLIGWTPPPTVPKSDGPAPASRSVRKACATGAHLLEGGALSFADVYRFGLAFLCRATT